MNKVKIKRRLHLTDTSEIEYRIDMLESCLKELRALLKVEPIKKQKANDICLGIQHGSYDLIRKTLSAIDSVGKEMK